MEFLKSNVFYMPNRDFTSIQPAVLELSNGVVTLSLANSGENVCSFSAEDLHAYRLIYYTQIIFYTADGKYRVDFAPHADEILNWSTYESWPIFRKKEVWALNQLKATGYEEWKTLLRESNVLRKRLTWRVIVPAILILIWATIELAN